MYWTNYNKRIIAGTYTQLTELMNELGVIGNEFYEIPGNDF